MALDALGEAGGGEELVEGVADVFQLGVQFVAVVVEPVLETFEQIAGKVAVRRTQARCPVSGGVAVGGDGKEAILDERLITLGGAGQAARFQPGGRPGDGVEQSLAVPLVISGPADVKTQADGEQQFVGGGGERVVAVRDVGEHRSSWV